MIELHRSGQFPIERLCTTYNMDKINEALADVRSGKVSYMIGRQALATDDTANR